MLCPAIRRVAILTKRSHKGVKAMERELRIAGLLFALFLTGLCSAPGLVCETGAQVKPKTVMVAHGVDLESLNPYWHNTTANYAVWRHFLEPLVEYDFSRRRYSGVLAESWSATEKGWTFKLRKNVKFHNGSELTAADVIYSLKRSMDPKLSRQLNIKGVVQSINAPDPYTVVIT